MADQNIIAALRPVSAWSGVQVFKASSRPRPEVIAVSGRLFRLLAHETPAAERPERGFERLGR